MFQYDEPLDSESFKVEHITLHPEFRYMLTQPDRYDLALLKLDHPVYYRENIIPICLPTMDYPLEGKIGVVAGWGKTDNSFGKTGTNLLNKVCTSPARQLKRQQRSSFAPKKRFSREFFPKFFEAQIDIIPPKSP